MDYNKSKEKLASNATNEVLIKSSEHIVQKDMKINNEKLDIHMFNSNDNSSKKNDLSLFSANNINSNTNFNTVDLNSKDINSTIEPIKVPIEPEIKIDDKINHVTESNNIQPNMNIDIHQDSNTNTQSDLDNIISKNQNSDKDKLNNPSLINIVTDIKLDNNTLLYNLNDDETRILNNEIDIIIPDVKVQEITALNKDIIAEDDRKEVEDEYILNNYNIDLNLNKPASPNIFI